MTTMIHEEIFTFKTRRKTPTLFGVFVLLNLVSYVLGATHEICPEQCQCYVDLKFEFNYHTAACTYLVWRNMYFPNIVQLKLEPASKGDQCHLPNITSRMFPKLQRLDMTNCSLTSLPTPGMNQFKSLVSIDLSNNFIREIPAKALLPYSELQHFSINNNPLNPQSSLIFESKSLYDLSLDSCNIHNLSAEMFAGLPNLRYLTISNNNISDLPYKVFPENLKSLNLSRNRLVNVPTFEFTRLEKLRELSIGGNPINCTCSLIEFQDWLPRKPLLVWDSIICAFPPEYKGFYLVELPEKKICSGDGSSFKETCAPNHICKSEIIIDEGYLNDQVNDESKDAFQKDEVIPINENESPVMEDINSDQMDGSGDGDTTDMPVDVPKKVETSSTSSTIMPEETSSPTTAEKTTESVPASNEGVVKLEDELGENGTLSSPDPGTSTPASVASSSLDTPVSVASSSLDNGTSTPVSVASSSLDNETSTPVSVASSSEVPISTSEIGTAAPEGTGTNVSVASSSEVSTITHLPTSENETTSLEGNGTNSELQERLRHNNENRELYGYIIPAVAVLLVGCVCLAVYCSQCASRVESYKPTETNVEAAELQEVSLLPDNNHATIVKHSNKYPGEKENGQTERLMHDHDQTNGGNNLPSEVNGNESQHSDDTIDCCKLANGQSTTNQSPPKNVECTVVKVTTLPDSIPKTAVIRDL